MKNPTLNHSVFVNSGGFTMEKIKGLQIFNGEENAFIVFVSASHSFGEKH